MEHIRGFQSLAEKLDYPMFIVTAWDGRERSGCLVGFSTQASLDPARFLVCVSQLNHTYQVAVESDLLGVHALRHQDMGLARLFGERTGDQEDKFARCRWEPVEGGLPMLVECPARFVGRVADRFDLGDHTGFLLDPLPSEVQDLGQPRWLGFQAVKGLAPGHPA